MTTQNSTYFDITDMTRSAPGLWLKLKLNLFPFEAPPKHTHILMHTHSRLHYLTSYARTAATSVCYGLIIISVSSIYIILRLRFYFINKLTLFNLRSKVRVASIYMPCTQQLLLQVEFTVWAYEDYEKIPIM